MPINFRFAVLENSAREISTLLESWDRSIGAVANPDSDKDLDDLGGMSATSIAKKAEKKKDKLKGVFT